MRSCCVPMLCLVAVGCAHASPASGVPAMAEADEALTPTAFSNPNATAEETAARALIDQLSRHDYRPAPAAFDEKMQAALPADKLEKTWVQWEGSWGPLVSIEEVHAQPFSKGWGALVVCRFDRGVHTLGVFFDPNEKISGFWSSPGIVAGNLFIDALGYHHPELADALSDSTLHDAAPTEKLAQAWTDIETSLGTFRGIRGVSDQGSAARVVVAFAHGKTTFNVAVDLRGKVTGFHIVGN